MKRTAQAAAALAVSLMLSSCALSRALYLGPHDYMPRAAPRGTEGRANGEDINGLFPAAVYIKTRTQTFNSYHYYIIRDGLIWYKSIDPREHPRGWIRFEKTGLPHNPRQWGFSKTAAVAEIAADADELVALSVEGKFYRYCFDPTIAHKSGVWLDRQGWPGVEQLSLDPRTANNISWAVGKRNSHVLYYEDPFGNQHHNGTQEIVTTYVLLNDGQEICYADTGLPADFSRNFTGPERGAFRAAALSASASTMFVINRAGEMYTRLADFDVTGCDPMFFKYSYTPYASERAGTDYFSNLTAWALPSEDWRPQPRIPLSGGAAITRRITILQNGQGNGARELRVAGRDASGHTGYWTKALFDERWEFKKAPLFFDADDVLQTAVPDGGAGYGDPIDERGPAPDKHYRGFLWRDGARADGFAYEIVNFNILEGDADLRITRREESCVLKLYPVEMWTYLKRDYLPGRTGSPKLFFATIVVPENALDGLSENFVRHVTETWAKNDRVLFAYTVAASNRYLIIRDGADTDAAFFLTRDGLSADFSLFTDDHYIEDFAGQNPCDRAELIIEPDAEITVEMVREKIRLNRELRSGLAYKIRAIRWSGLTAFKVNAGYLPAHYLALMTPLRFVDVPKIRTMTRFGEQLVLANSAYINAVSPVRIRLYERFIALLDERIARYRLLLDRPPDHS